MLTAAQIKKMRETADRALPDCFTLLGKTYGAGKPSGGSESFDPERKFRCRTSPLEGKEAEEAGVEWTEGLLKLIFAVGAPVETKKRILYRNVEYEVRAVMDGRAWQTSGRAIIERVRKERPR